MYDEVTILQTDVLPKAEQAFEAAHQGYQQGKFDYLYVLDAQRTLFEIRGRYIDAVEEHHKAQADVDRLTGKPANPAGEDKPSRGASRPSSQENSHAQ